MKIGKIAVPLGLPPRRARRMMMHRAPDLSQKTTGLPDRSAISAPARPGLPVPFAIALSISTSPYPNLRATIQSPAGRRCGPSLLPCFSRRARASAIDTTLGGQSSDLRKARAASSLATLWWTDRVSISPKAALNLSKVPICANRRRTFPTYIVETDCRSMVSIMSSRIKFDLRLAGHAGLGPSARPSPG
jgi:hypothetical protein